MPQNCFSQFLNIVSSYRKYCISSGDLPVGAPARGPTAEGADGVCEYAGEYRPPKIYETDCTVIVVITISSTHWAVLSKANKNFLLVTLFWTMLMNVQGHCTRDTAAVLYITDAIQSEGYGEEYFKAKVFKMLRFELSSFAYIRKKWVNRRSHLRHKNQFLHIIGRGLIRGQSGLRASRHHRARIVWSAD